MPRARKREYRSLSRTWRIPRTEILFSWQGDTNHGPATEPKNWPWWKAFHLSRVRVDGRTCRGRRLWIYTRTRLGALHVDWITWPDNRDLSHVFSLLINLRVEIEDWGARSTGGRAARARVAALMDNLERELGRTE